MKLFQKAQKLADDELKLSEDLNANDMYLVLQTRIERPPAPPNKLGCASSVPSRIFGRTGCGWDCALCG